MCRRRHVADAPHVSSMSTAVPLVGRLTTIRVLLNANTYLRARLAACERSACPSFLIEACDGAGRIHFQHPSTFGHAVLPRRRPGNPSQPASIQSAMGFFNGKGGKKGRFSAGASSSRGQPATSPSARCGTPPRERERLYIPVHQARWHWQYRQPVPYPDVNLPHGWHLDPQRIPIPVALWSVGDTHNR